MTGRRHIREVVEIIARILLSTFQLSGERGDEIRDEKLSHVE